MEGWIKLHRQLLESAIFKNERLLKEWIWCLLKASHKKCEIMVGNQLVSIEEGQFIFGRKDAANELGVNENTLYKDMKNLEKLKMCNIKSNNKFSIVTIEKWSFYQDIDENNNSKNNNNVTTTEQQNNNNVTQTRRLDYILNNKINILNIVREKILETGCWITDKKLNEKFDEMLKYSPDNPEEYLFKSLMKEVEK